MTANENSAKDLIRNMEKLGKSELRLAAAEFKEAASHLRSESKTFLVSVATALLGLPPLVAFLVIGLGRLLGENYWLSSLIVGLILTGIGGAVAHFSLRRLELKNLTFPKTRENLRADGEAAQKAIRIVKEGGRS